MPGVDFLQLNAADAPRGGIATWLTDALRAAIGDGRLTTDDRLPPSRGMAAELGVSRGVVVEAYQRLVDEGLAVTEGARGTRVAAVPRQVPVAPPTPAEHRPDRVDLSPGLPDLSAFPRAAWLRCTRAVLAEVPAAELGYGDPQGHPRLRAELARWLSRSRGVRAGAEDVVVVAGVAQALALTAQVLVDRGHRDIAVEDPGSQGTREELERWGLRTRPVPVDGDGMDVDALAATGASTALLTPAHQFPTGVVLSPERRRALIGWGRLVIEDDYDAEHRYDRAPVPALQGLGPDRVVYAGSVSKTLAPGLRLGWVVAPAPCARRSPGPSTWPISATRCSTSWCSPASSPRASSNATCAACGSASAPVATRCSTRCASTCRTRRCSVWRRACTCWSPCPGPRRRRAGRRGGRGGRARPPALDPPDHARTARARARLRRAGAGPHPGGDRPARGGVPLCRTPGSARVTARA